MKRKDLLKIFIVIILFMLFVVDVKATSLSVSSSSTSVTIGTTIKISATFYSDSLVYFTEGSLKCIGAGVNQTLDLSNNNPNDKSYLSYSFNIKPTSSGTINCTSVGAKMIEATAPNDFKNVNSSISITVKEPVYIPPKTYSSNNNLSSLEVEGYAISPAFSKDVKEYSLEVPNGVEKVNIKATLEDSTASVSGTGEISVSEGINKVEVKVTAENGNENVYVINITVKELDPIEVEIDGEKYTIIRKEGVLEVPSNYEKSSIKIGDDDVLCYKNEVTGNILIGLKDEDGNSRYYSYDDKTNAYTLYNGYRIGGINLNIISMPSGVLPSGYGKVTFEYEDNKIEGYQYIDNNVTYAAGEDVKGSDFYLVYAVNEISGDEGLYVYDKLEGTVQRYNSNLVLAYQNKADNYFLYMLISLIVLAVTIITFMIVLITKNKHKHKFA